MNRAIPRFDSRFLAVVIGALLLSVLLLGLVPSGAAADYYNNSSAAVSSSSPSNATLENILYQAVSLSPDLIGTGQQDPSGTGFQGVLLIGVIFAMSSLGMMAGTRVGPIGATILGSAVSYGLVDLGFAPVWIKPLLLFAIGAVCVIMFRRVLGEG